MGHALYPPLCDLGYTRAPKVIFFACSMSFQKLVQNAIDIGNGKRFG